MASPAKFARNMEERAQQVRDGVLVAMKTAASTGLIAAVDFTPVDTGLARSNWVVGLNVLPNRRLKPHAPGKFLMRGETANASAAIASGENMVGRARLQDVIYMTNSIHHIAKLNHGHSGQHPGNFLHFAAIRANRRIMGFKVFSGAADLKFSSGRNRGSRKRGKFQSGGFSSKVTGNQVSGGQ